MAEAEDKKDKFSAAINHYAEEQRKKIEDEISTFKQKELDEAEIEVLTECYRMIQKELVQMRSGISREMAQKELSARRELLDKRQKITDEVFSRAAQKLTELIQSEKYTELLKKAAEKFKAIFTKPGTVICLKADDAKYEDLIREAFGSDCTFQADPTIGVGGIRAFNPGMGLMADETFDSLLEEQRGWFEEHSGMTVV